MGKKTAFIIPWVIAVACIAAKFGIKHHQKVMTQARMEQAQQNAAAYIKNKYGFDAEISELDDSPAGQLYKKLYKDTDNQYSAVKMRANGKDFYVWSDMTQDNTTLYDNYQRDEIESAVRDYLKVQLPDTEVTSISYRPDETGKNTGMVMSCMINDNYDGSNLEQIMENNPFTVAALCYGVDIANDPLLDELDKAGANYNMVSFDTKEHMLSCKAEYITNHRGTFDDYYPEYAPYVMSSAITMRGKRYTDRYKLKSNGDFMYGNLYETYFTGDEKMLAGRGDIQLSEDKDGLLKKFFDAYNEGYALKKPLSKSYHFEQTTVNSYIFYPLEYFKKKGIDVENTGIAYCLRSSSVVNNRDIAKPKTVDGYAVYSLDNYDQYFMLVDTTDLNYTPEWKNNKYSKRH